MRGTSAWKVAGRMGAAAIAAAALAAGGCAGTSETAGETGSTAGAGYGEPSPVPSEFEQGGMQGAEPRSVSGAGESESELELSAIYFDFDSAAIREDQRQRLRSNAQALRSHLERGDGTVVVEGHCDERGDEEYNLALGQRRADVVRRYLVDLGVQRNRVRIVSYGEAKPAVAGHDESSWRWNRRAEFRVGSS